MTCVDGVASWTDDCGDQVKMCECGCDDTGTSCQSCECTPDCVGKVCGPDGCGGGCPPGCQAPQVCDVTQGQCTDSCLIQAYKDCYPGPEEGADIRWFDSCGNPEGIVEDCPDLHSACSTAGGQPACVCMPGWTGPDCDLLAPAEVDILFVVDNSGSMAGEQTQLARSFDAFTATLQENSGNDYHIAVITTGMESAGCPPCDPPFIPGSCMNETGENGRFQDRICKNEGSVDDPLYTCRQDTSCRVVTHANKTCFYDEMQQEGIAFVGVNGCGYEKGLAPMHRALEDDLINSYNANFLRENAILAVVIISDEEDCGEVGDATENIPTAMGLMCYYAAKGVGPDGETSHPDDPDGRLYRLTPVEDYYNFLVNLKGGNENLVKFAAIVGVENVNDLGSTTIEYIWDDQRQRWDIENACVTAGCTGRYCFAKPGTRYIKLAQMFGIGQNGFVDTICQNDLTSSMENLARFISPR